MTNWMRALAAMTFSLVALTATAGDRVAVVNVRDAILNTDIAQERLQALRNQADYVASRNEVEALQNQQRELYERLQRDLAVMSAEQQAEGRRQLESLRGDLEHVVRKLQKAEQELAQGLLQEMAPKVQQQLGELIKAEAIGLLLDSQAALHADSSFNLTPKLTERLNQPR